MQIRVCMPMRGRAAHGPITNSEVATGDTQGSSRSNSISSKQPFLQLAEVGGREHTCVFQKLRVLQLLYHVRRPDPALLRCRRPCCPACRLILGAGWAGRPATTFQIHTGPAMAARMHFLPVRLLDCALGSAKSCGRASETRTTLFIIK